MANALPLICENRIPDRFYKVINQLDPETADVYVFVGQVSANIQSILEGLQKGGEPSEKNRDELLKHFGLDYKKILGLQSPNKNKITYVNDLIEVDDSVAGVKNKIGAYLRTLIDWQYLYVYLNTEGGKIPVSLGHSFVKWKENKKSEDELIDYEKNPYKNIELADPSMNYFVDQHSGLKLNNQKGGYTVNDTNGMLITEYDIVDNEIYLVTYCSFLRYFQKTKKKYVGQDLIKFKNGYLVKYWPDLVLSNETKMNELYETCATKSLSVSQGQLDQLLSGSEFKNIVEKVDRDSYVVTLIKNPPKEIGNADVKFENCVILEIVLHINYDSATTEFIDLMKIFDRYKLSMKVPFVKYKGEKTREPRHKLYTPAIDETPIETIQDWISNIQKKKKDKDDAPEYHVSGKGLSFKHLLYQNVNEETGEVSNKYATINFYKDGKIELKCFWEEHKNATLNDVRQALIDLVSLVREINKIEYHLPGVSRQRRIAEPDPNFMQSKKSNTQIAFINTVTRFNFGDSPINFDKINEFASCFNSYVSIVKKNFIEEWDATQNKHVIKPVMNTSLQLRYKRINNYFNMSIVDKFIYDITKQTTTAGIEKVDMIKLIAERFNVVQEVAAKIYLSYEAKQGAQTEDAGSEQYENIDYVLGKKIRKHPGIDIKIQGQEDKYKIFILGAKNTFQLSLIHQFLKSFVRLFKKTDVLYADPKFKAQVKKGLCDLSKSLIDEKIGIEEGVDAYMKLSQAKKAAKLIHHDLDIQEEDMDDILAALGQEPDGDLIAELADKEQTEKDKTKQSDSDSDTEKGDGEDKKEPEAPKTGKKTAKFDYTKEINPLARLKDADPELFKGAQYATTCQKNAYKQPMVVDVGTYKEKRVELEKRLKEITDKESQLTKTKPDGYQKQLGELATEKEIVNSKITIYKQGVEYRKNYYFCPLGYEYSTERILHPDEIEGKEAGVAKDKVTGNPVYYVKKKSKLNYAGFAEKQVHGELCAPCCFAKPNMRFDQCLGAGGPESKIDTKVNLRYILAAEKTGIAQGRFGMLPEVLNLIFNSGVKSDNKISTGYDFYLRKGVNPEPPHNIFLNAVGDALTPPKEGSTLRKEIISKLTLQTFLSLKSGGLKLVFQNDKEPDNQAKSLAGFKEFIEDNNYIDEDFLWDYLTMPGILTPKGFNLFVFESHGASGKTGENIVLKCPIAYEIADLYNSSKPSLVLYKYSNRYEPIYRVQDNGTVIKTIEMFPPEHPIVKKLISMADQCHPVRDDTAYENEENMLKKSNMPKKQKLDDPATLKATLDDINEWLGQLQEIKSKPSEKDKPKLKQYANILEDFKPVSQIIDEYNKAVYLVLANKFAIPVKPSSRQPGLLITKYDSLVIFDYDTTYAILKQLSDNVSVPIKPIMTLTDGHGKHYIGIMLDNGLTVEIKPLKISDAKAGGVPVLPTVKQYYQGRADVDMSIAKINSVAQVDQRLHYVNLRKFEDESYQRLRYELSKELQKKEYSKLISTIREIIADSTINIGDKREKLLILLDLPIKSIIITVRQKPYNYDSYVVPNVRTQCITKTKDDCATDPHCEYDSKTNQCKLYIEPMNLLDKKKSNINRYTSLIIEELLKNHLRRTELLEDQVDNTVNENIYEYRQDEMIFKDATYKDNKKRLERLYKTDIDYYERLSKLYDTANPLYYQDHDVSKLQNLLTDKLTYSSCHQDLRKLSVQWRQDYVGDNYRALTNDGSTDCLYYALSMALNQRDTKEGKAPHTIESIRNYVADHIDQLPDEPSKGGKQGRKGWQLLLDHIKYLFKDRTKEVYTLSELKEYMKSSLHQPSLIDIMMISRLYDTKFIIMSRKRSPNNPSGGFVCIGSTQSTKNSYIMLYRVEWETYEIVVNITFSPNKYIFTKEDLPTKLYQKWFEICGKTDMHDKVDAQIPLLLEAPVYKVFDIPKDQPPAPPVEPASSTDANKPAKIKIGIKSASAKGYYTDPATDQPIAHQVAKKAKIPIKEKTKVQIENDKEKADLKKQVIAIAEKKKIPIKVKASHIAQS